MAIGTLFEQGYDALLAEAEKERHLPWCFIHIPKTAGVSFAQEASECFRYKNVFLNEADYHLIETGRLSFTEALTSRLETCRERVIAGEFNFISGHLHYSKVHHILDSFGGIRLLTFLRHPVDRVISDFRYCQSTAFPNCVQFREKYPDMQTYLADRSEANKIHKYLCSSDQEPAADTTRRTAETFAFVGLVEDYEFYRNLFWAMNGLRPPAAKRLNVTENSIRSRVSFDGLRQQIADANEDDMTIYAYFRERSARIRGKPLASHA